MAFGKRILRMAPVRKLACFLLAGYVRLVKLTGRWRTEAADIPEALLKEGQPFIVAFWHGRLFMSATAWRYDRPFNMVISEHPDGQLIAGTVGHLGISTIAGSTTRGGSRVFRQLLRALRNGECAGITPDGPQGPRMQAGRGIVEAARISGAPIVPLAYSAKPSWLVSSWDRLMIPLPFSRGVFLWGDPMSVPKEADDAEIERLAARVESALNDMTAGLDRRLGVPPVMPAKAEAQNA